VIQVVGDRDDVEPLDAIPVDDGNRRTLVAVVSWGLLAVVLVTAGWWIWTKVLFPDGGSIVSQYANREVAEWYTSAEDQFRASFPTTPIRQTRADSDGRIVTVASRPGSGYIFSVTRQPVSVDVIADYDTTLNQFVGELASQGRFEIVSQTPPVRFLDVATKDALLRKGDTYRHVWLVAAADRMYVLDVTTPGNDAKAAKRFREDFTKLGD
jgi:hypothetical protein